MYVHMFLWMVGFVNQFSSTFPYITTTPANQGTFFLELDHETCSYDRCTSSHFSFSQSCNSRPLSSWNQPGFTSTTHVPECLSTTLQTLEWRDYAETEFDMPVVSFLLKNATRLTEAKIFPESAAGPIEKLRIRTGLAKLSRGSPLCHLNLGN